MLRLTAEQRPPCSIAYFLPSQNQQSNEEYSREIHTPTKIKVVEGLI
jgi:hypothetical protein